MANTWRLQSESFGRKSVDPDNTHNVVEQSWHPDSTTKEADKFPVRLHYVLSEMEKDGLQHVASWQYHGRCFFVHDKKQFTQNILPFWFRQSKFDSFQRQLNTYGFVRITSGPDKGGYYHKLFLRGKSFLTLGIQRKKKTRPVMQGASDNNPDPYKLPSLQGMNSNHHTKNLVSPSSVASTEHHLFTSPPPTASRNANKSPKLFVKAHDILVSTTGLPSQTTKQLDWPFPLSLKHWSTTHSTTARIVPRSDTWSNNLSLVDIINQELKSYHENRTFASARTY